MEKFNESQKIIRAGEKYILIFPVSHIRESHVNETSHFKWLRILYSLSKHTADKGWVLNIIYLLIRSQLELQYASPN